MPITKDIIKRPLSLIIVAGDKYPLFRVETKVLFGKEIASRGHRMLWLLQSDNNCRRPYFAEWQGGKVRVGGMDRGGSLAAKLRKNINSFLLDVEFIFFCLSRKDDIIQVKDKFFVTLPALLLSKIRNMKFIFWLSYPFPESYINDSRTKNAPFSYFYLIKGLFIKYILYRVIFPLAHHSFVQSEQMRCDVIERGAPKNKLTVMPIGIDKDVIKDNMHGSSKIGDSDPNVLFTGMFFKVRRLDFLIRVVYHVRKSISQAKLYMVGAGEDENLLRDEVRRLGLENAVYFTGFLPYTKMLDYVKRADVCISPSYPSFLLNSTSPTKLIEYMAMGKAVVATDHPEQRLIIKESGGGLCVPYDEIAVAEALIVLLQDPTRCRTMGRRGRAYVMKHRTYNVIADIVEQTYYDVTGI